MTKKGLARTLILVHDDVLKTLLNIIAIIYKMQYILKKDFLL